MVLFSMSVFDSCKDYDEDEYNDLIIALNQQDQTSKYIINNYAQLVQLRDSIIKYRDQCAANCSTARAQLEQKLTGMINDQMSPAEFNDSIQKYLTRIVNLETDYSNLNNLYVTINNNLTNVQNSLSNVASQVSADSALIQQILASMKADDGSVVDVKTVQSNLDKVMNTIYNAAGDDNFAKKETVDELVGVVNTLKETVGNITSFNSNDYYTKTQIDGMLAGLGNTDLLNSKIDDVSKVANEALARAKNDSIWVKNLENTVAEVNSYAKEALERAKNDSVWVKNLESVVEQLNKDLTARVDSLAEVTTALDQAVKTAEENRKAADQLLQDQIDALAVGMANINTFLDTEISALSDAYLEADKALQDSIDDLAEKVKKNADDIAALSDKIDEITGRLDKIDEALKSLITGIVIQQTKNPVFGTFATPFGVNTNVLMAFYGQTANQVEFPTYMPANYVKNSEKLTAEDWAMLNNPDIYEVDGGVTLLSDADDNAGTLYLTVNPGSVDFAGQTLQLVNSKDEESKVTLSPLVKENDTELLFGYTRAAETNGFYSAKAKLAAEDIESVKVNIDKSLKDAFTSVLKERTAASVGELTTKLYHQFDGILPAQGVKASWTDYNGEHSVYSQYGIAAAAFKPLSFAFLEDLDVKTVPGYERALSLVDRIANEAKSTISIKSVVGSEIYGDIRNFKIKKIELDDLNDDLVAKFKVSMDTTIVISGISYHLQLNEPVHISFTQEASVNIGGVKVDATVPSMHVTVDANGNAKMDGFKIPIEDAFGNAVLMDDGTGNPVPVFVTVDDQNITVDVSGGGDTPETPMVATIKKGTTVVATVPIDTTVYVDINKMIDLDDQSFKFSKSIDMRDAIEDLWGNVQSEIGGVNDMLTDLEDILADVNDLLDKVDEYDEKIDTKIDDYTTKVRNFIDRVNDRMSGVINSANRRIQPVLLLTGDNTGTKRVSRSTTQPTTLKEATVTLIPTTYTAEIVAPAFKKHIAVTNVFKGNASAQGGDAACKAALQNANKGDMNKVIEGSNREITVTFEAGYIYEIAYSALDYSGKISMHKYYVRF